MKIVIAGSSGLIGTALRSSLRKDGYDVTRLVRRPPAADNEVEWDPGAGRLDPGALQGATAVVNLAGVGIGDRRWSDEHKRAVLQSRLDATGTIVTALASVDGPTPALVNASAIGYYGGRDDEELTEESSPGDDFVASVTRQWEAAAGPAGDAGSRVVLLRTGLVLAAEGGLLPRTVLPFKLGLGAVLGSGEQYWSWITIDDEVRAIRFLIDRADLSGPFNLTAPNPVPFRVVAKTLGRVLRRPVFLPAPDFALKLLLGAERAEGLILEGQRVVPQRLTGAGFTFRFGDLEPALRHVLGK